MRYERSTTGLLRRNGSPATKVRKASWRGGMFRSRNTRKMRVQGTVKVERGATLMASRISVIGSVQAEGAAAVNVAASSVGGSVQIVQGRNSRLDRNSVQGDVQYFESRGTISITGNRVDGNLQCKENSPPPTGGGNVVQGNKDDQCARL